MRIATITIILLLTFVRGCTDQNHRIDPEDFLHQFQTSLEQQGLKVEVTEPSFSADIHGLIPYEYSISLKGDRNDTVFIFFTDSMEQATKTLVEANFMVSLITKVGTYTKDNVILMQFAYDGNLNKYRSQIYTALSSNEK